MKFDFEVDFSNGGSLQGQDFRLDIEGEDVCEEALAPYIVEDTGEGWQQEDDITLLTLRSSAASR